MKIENSDVVIIGSGAAGLICALTLSKKFKIILLTKKKSARIFLNKKNSK